MILSARVKVHDRADSLSRSLLFAKVTAVIWDFGGDHFVDSFFLCTNDWDNQTRNERYR